MSGRRRSGDPSRSRHRARPVLLAFLVLALVAAGCSGGGTENALGVDPDVFLPTSMEGISDAVDVSVGPTHACAVMEDGTVSCWGSNGAGQLGDDTFIDSGEPVEVVGISNAVDVSVGAAHACAVMEDGTISCWGDNGFGQLGEGQLRETGVPVAVEGIANATDVSAGDGYTCAVLEDGTVACWGYRSITSSEELLDSRRPVAVEGISNAVALSAVGFCALLDDGTVSCWDRVGSDDGVDVPIASAPPVAVLGMSNVAALSDDGSCALAEDGTVHCLEHSEDRRSYEPVLEGAISTTPVEGVADATAISDSCAVLGDGSVSCWRDNHDQDESPEDTTGDDEDNDSLVAVEVEGVSHATAVSSNVDAGLDMSCVLDDEGDVMCWGTGAVRNTRRDTGTLEDPPRRPNPPMPVEGIDTAVAVSINLYEGCVLASDSTVMCWMMSSGSRGSDAPPVTVRGISGATSVSARGPEKCAVLENGTVSCWNTSSEDGATVTTTPVPVPGISTAIAVDGRCALLDDGTATCWEPIYSEPTDEGGEILTGATPPVPVTGLADIAALSGDCFVLADGSVTCRNDSEISVPVAGISGAADISQEDDLGCALLDSGAVSCWGHDSHGQLGDGLPEGTDVHADADRPVAAGVVGISAGTDVAATDYRGHACAALADGTASCWGHNRFGELGDGTFANRHTPVTVKGVSGVIAVAVAQWRSCALIADGTVMCWGDTE